MGLFLPPLSAGCGIDTEGILTATDTTAPDDEGMDGDGSADVDADDHRPDGDAPDDAPPDDGSFPDVLDTEVEGPATCAEMPASFCDDGRDCTNDGCRDDAAGPQCTHDVLSTTCLIESTCYAAWSINLANDCQICDPSVNNAWTPVADGNQCSWGDGRCCSGWCVPWESCCSDDDCAGCTGLPASCESIVLEDACRAHLNCEWTPSGTCSGGSRCDALSSSSACATCGCFWDYSHCDPDAQVFNCSAYSSSYADCAAYASCGCTWISTGGGCGGEPLGCPEFDASTCSLQSGCSWRASGTCNTTTFICE